MPYLVLLAIAANRFVGPYARFLVMHMVMDGWPACLGMPTLSTCNTLAGR
jgi:hypothetical protein